MKTTSSSSAVGVWLIGAYGDIATTLMVGTHAITQSLASTNGLITSVAPFTELPLVELSQLRFGGCDIRDTRLVLSAEEVYRRSRTYSREILDAVCPALEHAQSDIATRTDFTWNPQQASSADTGPTLAERVDGMRQLLREFKTRHRLSHVVVVNLASAEPLAQPHASTHSLTGLEQLIQSNAKQHLSPSDCQAYAALAEGCPYLNFTPSRGGELGGLQELALRNRIPFGGNDGKTGETLVKTALAPMFAYRHLQVLSWEGVNLLGNNDGATLSHPENRTAKIANKGNVLHKILGYPVHSGVTINYVPSLGDWKTAWDLIHFSGFLDAPMTMQFTWQGCDSILAAPLVLDMIRLADFALRRGEAGPMRHLACFFKNPIGVEEHSFYRQFQMLLAYAQHHLGKRNTVTE
jgi:myo-inositol-1-phosphate synthase